MKQQLRDQIIDIAWSADDLSAAAAREQLVRLAQVLGRMAARRDLAKAQEMPAHPSSDVIRVKMPDEVLC